MVDRQHIDGSLAQVSVVVPTRNRAPLLEVCLGALRSQAGVSFEVIVIDDGSTDGTQWVASAGADVSLRNERSTGPAGARNRGIRAATGAFVAFTDDDCVPRPNWLRTLVERLAASPPEVVGVGGRVVPAAGGWVAAYMTQHRILEPPESLEYLVTANCAFRRDALVEVGGFDESVREAGGEDPGLSHALRKAGYRFCYEPGAIVEHHYRKGFREFVRTFYRYGKGCRVVLDR